MKDYLFYNIPKDSVDFSQFRGQYNIYLLCRKGRVCFRQSNKEIEAREWDFVVWPRLKKYDSISFSEDAEAEVFLVSDYFLDLYKPETAWDVPGFKYLKAHPVLRLLDDDYDEQNHIGSVFNQLKERIEYRQLIFEEEVIGNLLRVMLYDIWCIVDRTILVTDDSDLPLKHFGDFLYEAQQDCGEKRDVASYAKMMELTPKYLTELSNQVTGRPASNWIDYYAARLLRKELSAKDVPFTDIAEKMKFSSLPAFSRYVKRVLGCSPTEYRESLKHKGKLY